MIKSKVASLEALAHSQKQTNETGVHQFFNTVKLLPIDVHNVAFEIPDGFASTKDLFSEYLKIKFFVLLEYTSGSDLADISRKCEEIFEIERIDDDTEELVRNLVENFHDNEIYSFLARFLEFGREHFIEIWGDSDNEYLASWTELILQRLLETQFDLKSLQIKNLENFSGIIILVNDIFSQIGKIDDITLNDFEVARRANRSMSELQEKLFSPEDSKDTNLEIFLTHVKDRYSCEVVDYLKVADIEIDSAVLLYESGTRAFGKVGFQAASSDRYRLGEGISGTTLYLPRGTGLGCCGTNNAFLDCRMSEKHYDEYVEKYGPLQNYWCIPIIKDNRLHSCFRVVNKLDEDGAPSSWSFSELRELLAFAVFCSEKIDVIEAKNDERFENFGFLSSTNRFINELTDGTNSPWLERLHLGKIVDHISQAALRKVEKKSIGCSIVIVSQENAPKISSGLKEYPTVDEMSLRQNFELINLNKSYEFVDPDHGFFLLNEDLEFLGCFQISDPANAPMFFERKLQNVSEALAFYLKKDSRCIRIFKEGLIAGDFYLPDDKGYWIFRDFQKLNSKMFEVVDAETIDRNMLNLLFLLSWDLALAKVGSILIFPRKSDDFEKIVSKYHLKNVAVNVSSIRDDLVKMKIFFDLAGIDGALVFDVAGSIHGAGTMVKNSSRPMPFSSSDMSAPGGRTLERPNARIGGARHAAGRNVARNQPCVVFVVSENGGISCYFRDEAIFERE